ncbi:unnamed protein product [Vitrella brassicaformis CCMP3155]|uniref:FAD/NAD(P)-binding domain-containing protein n=2 Tax=Vitrella brassicaformis TaxID=1169539 RepID=A0A0G4FP32_VITBC|nr:unnamed protein product [Vitrella brassicaformis CCMP3155]|eukprot:CEM15577.1 unnamed protein product [Vitrella brassicaformis CCMP3155]
MRTFVEMCLPLQLLISLTLSLIYCHADHDISARAAFLRISAPRLPRNTPRHSSPSRLQPSASISSIRSIRRNGIALPAAADGTAASARTSGSDAESSANRICIVGGGFGGLLTALGLSKLPWKVQPEITLIDTKDQFVFLPLLYELAVGTAEQSEVAPLFRELLYGTGIRFVKGRVDSIDVDGKKLSVSGAGGERRELGYGRLVLAMGGEPSAGGIPGVERALRFTALNDAIQLKKEIQRIKRIRDRPARVVLVGGGYIGVELATNLAAALSSQSPPPQISLLHRGPQLMPLSAEHNRKQAIRALREARVDVSLETSVASIRPASDTSGSEVVVQKKGSEDSSVLPADLVIMTAGVRASGLADMVNGRVERGRGGRLAVERTLAVKGLGDVYAIGDVADLGGVEGEGTAQAAFQQADYLVWNIWASYNDKKPLAYRYTKLGEMLTFGPLDGSVAALGDRVTLGGPLASIARRSAYIIRQPTPRQRLRAALSYLGLSSQKGLLRTLVDRFPGRSRATEIPIEGGSSRESDDELSASPPVVKADREEQASGQPWTSLEPLSGPVFVAGATGRTGRRVVRSLLEQGWRVVAGVRPGGITRAEAIYANSSFIGQEEDIKGRLEFREWDGMNEDSISRAIQGCPFVVCALGANSLSLAAPSTVDGKITQNLIRISAATAPYSTETNQLLRHFVLVTSLGTGSFGLPASSLNLFGGILLIKRQSERLLEKSGLQYTIVRPGGLERAGDDYEREHPLVVYGADEKYGGIVSRQQVADLCAQALCRPEVSKNKIFEAVTATGSEAAQLISERQRQGDSATLDTRYRDLMAAVSQ